MSNISETLGAVRTKVWNVVRATFLNARADDIVGEGAKIAYFFFLSLFPLVLVLLVLTSLIGGEAAFERITDTVQTTVPDYAWQFVNSIISEVSDRRPPGTLSFGILFALWSASNGIAALTGGLNTMYDVEEQRPWLKRRLLALVVLLIGAILLVLSSAAFIPAQDWLQNQRLWVSWAYARWPLSFLLLTATAWISYSVLPAGTERPSKRKTLIGAGVASGLWMLSTFVFRWYVAGFGDYNRVYGAIGAVVVLLLWFYIAALAVLIGGELAATLQTKRRSRPELRD